MVTNPFKQEAPVDNKNEKIQEAITKIEKSIEELKGFSYKSVQSSPTSFPQPFIAGFCFVQANGTFFPNSTGLPVHQPTNWTITKGTAGLYTLNHNIGTLSYLTTLIPFTTTSAVYSVNIGTMTNTTVTYNIVANGAPTDVPHQFVIYQTS